MSKKMRTLVVSLTTLVVTVLGTGLAEAGLRWNGKL